MSNTAIASTEWRIIEEKDQIELAHEDVSVCFMAFYGDEEKEEARQEAAAIVAAVNNTYGAGINPGAVKDMLAALRAAKAAILHSGATGGQTNYDALEAVTIAIEKAKLSDHE